MKTRFDHPDSLAYCQKHGKAQPHIKVKDAGSGFETSTCCLCKPEILDADGDRTFPFNSFTPDEAFRMNHVRERWASAWRFR